MDRRNYPRLYTHFPAELVAGGKRAVVRVLAVDVSITGLQVEAALNLLLDPSR